MRNIKENNCYTVYMHTSPSGKRYIRITSQLPKERWQNGRGYSYNSYFYNAINKYSWKNIKYEILFEGLTKEEAEQKEIELIAKYKSNQREFGYNIDNGGSCVGRMSEETKQKISETHIGLLAVPVCQYSRDGVFIKRHSSVNKAASEMNVSYTAISACCRGLLKIVCSYIWRYDDEQPTKEHIDWCNDKNNYGKRKSVCQYDLNGKLLNTYSGIVEAEKVTGLNQISNCCNRKLKTSGGYIWRHEDDILTEKDLMWCNSKNESQKKKVKQYSLDGEFINEYDSLTEVKKTLGFDNAAISRCCKGKQKISYGFIWRYVDDENN